MCAPEECSARPRPVSACAAAPPPAHLCGPRPTKSRGAHARQPAARGRGCGPAGRTRVGLQPARDQSRARAAAQASAKARLWAEPRKVIARLQLGPTGLPSGQSSGAPARRLLPAVCCLLVSACGPRPKQPACWRAGLPEGGRCSCAARRRARDQRRPNGLQSAAFLLDWRLSSTTDVYQSMGPISCSCGHTAATGPAEAAGNCSRWFPKPVRKVEPFSCASWARKNFTPNTSTHCSSPTAAHPHPHPILCIFLLVSSSPLEQLAAARLAPSGDAEQLAPVCNSRQACLARLCSPGADESSSGRVCIQTGAALCRHCVRASLYFYIFLAADSWGESCKVEMCVIATIFIISTCSFPICAHFCPHCFCSFFLQVKRRKWCSEKDTSSI